MEEVSIDGLDANRSDWTQTTGDPTKYYIRRDTQTVIGLRPTPLANSTHTLTVWFYARANDLSANADVPFNNFREMYSYHYLLALYAAYRGWLVMVDRGLAELYYSEYIQGINIMKSAINTGPNFSPAIRGDRGPGR